MPEGIRQVRIVTRAAGRISPVFNFDAAARMVLVSSPLPDNASGEILINHICRLGAVRAEMESVCEQGEDFPTARDSRSLTEILAFEMG